MPLFVCDACNSIDNTALTNFWTRVHGGPIENGRNGFGHEDTRALCSGCDPDIREWHDAFPRREWDGIRLPESHPGALINRLPQEGL
jgi:hypothetical protein